MTATDVLLDGFSRVRGVVENVLKGAGEATLTHRIDPEANTIAWLVWHIARGQDAQIAPLAGGDEVWTRDGFADRFALPFPHSASGYGQTSEEVGAVDVSADLLGDYYDASHEATLAFLRTLDDADLERVVDTAWVPPVTLGVRLMSILDDNLQHAGQAAYVRGVTARLGLR